MVKCYYFTYFGLLDDSHHSFVCSDFSCFLKELTDILNSHSFLLCDIGGFNYEFN